MTQVITKYFTYGEAQNTLPLVKSIVNDILLCGKELQIISELTEEEIRTNTKIRILILQMQKYIEELEELGCYYKDWNFNIGLVDFPSLIDGQDVLLCWRSDEEKIDFYHSHSEGYKGRKQIPDVYRY